MSIANHEWLPVLAVLTEKRIPCVLLTVMEAKGSTPREAGAKMVVTASEQFGTVGGGNLEFEAVAEARKLLSGTESASKVKDYPLGPKLAQCCGGAVSIFLEPFIPTGKTIYLFGAGHVGREVVKVFENLPVHIRWVDSRENEFPDFIPSIADKIYTDALSELRNVRGQDFILIMTHSHDLDYELVREAFSTSCAYIGLIGSNTKRVRFEKRLKADGVAAEMSRLICPIGIEGITGKHPREIAIAVAAELLQRHVTQVSADAPVQKIIATENKPAKELASAGLDHACKQSCGGCD